MPPISPPAASPIPGTTASTLVVDSSAIAALLFGEPAADAVRAAIDGAALAAPMLLPIELGSVCRQKLRRAPETAARLMIAYDARGLLGITLHEVDHDGVLRLAVTSGLSFYDACYLWLARALGAELVTLDKQLAAAARA